MIKDLSRWQIGKLYIYIGSGSLPIWARPSTFSYQSSGELQSNIPFLIIDQLEHNSASPFGAWIKILIEEKIGWIKSDYLNPTWINPIIDKKYE